MSLAGSHYGIPAREIRALATSGSQVTLAARIGNESMFQIKTAGLLGIPPSRRVMRPHRTPSGEVCWDFDTGALIKPSRNGAVPYLAATLRFAAEARVNTLGPTAWFQLFPGDIRAAGEALWRQLVGEGRVPEKAPVTAIDVETGKYAVFDDLYPALHWAESFPRPTVYLCRFEPHVWPFLERTP